LWDITDSTRIEVIKRREVIKKSVLAAVIGIPVVTSLSEPMSVLAAVTCGVLPTVIVQRNPIVKHFAIRIIVRQHRKIWNTNAFVSRMKE
jgi:hypothetical protein